MKTALIIAAVLVLLLVIVTLGGGYYMYRFAIVRKKRSHDYWNEPLKPIEYAPEEMHKQMFRGEQFIKSQNTEIVKITSFDGLQLAARVLDCEKPRAAVILVHGYRSHPVNDFSCVFEFYTKMNFAIIAIDHRAHGISEGKHIGFGVTERYDIVDWAKYAGERWSGVPVVLDGVSMGGATVMMGAGVGYPDNVRAIIADCGYTTPGAICRKVLKQWFHLPPFPIYYAAKLFVRLFAGYNLDGASSRESLEKLKGKNIPVLIAHGKADDFVPYEMSVENMKAFDEGEAVLITSEEAPHGMAFFYSQDEYVKAIHDLFKRAGIDVPAHD